MCYNIVCIVRRKLQKEKRKELHRRKVEAGVDAGPSRKTLKRNTMKNSRCEITVAVDLSFDDLMSDKVVVVDILLQQLYHLA